MNNTYNSFLTILEHSNICIEELYKYYQTQKLNKQIKTITEDMSNTIIDELIDNVLQNTTDIVNSNTENNVEMLLEEINLSSNNVEVIKKTFTPWEKMLKNKSWADDDSDDECECSIKSNITSTSSDSMDTNKSHTNSKKEQEVKLSSEDESIYKTINKKKNKINEKKKDIQVIYNLQDFLNCLKNKKKTNIDFTIDESAHCEHTYNGTLCNNVRKCKKIHIQRCMVGNNCTYKNCSYIHSFNMKDEESKVNFTNSMELYNKIKANKKVNNN